MERERPSDHYSPRYGFLFLESGAPCEHSRTEDMAVLKVYEH